MKKIYLILLLGLLTLCATSCKQKEVQLDDFNDTLSWVLGEKMGQQYAMLAEINKLKTDPKIVEQAFAHALEGNPPALDSTTTAIIYRVFEELNMRNQQPQSTSQPVATTSGEEQLFANLTAQNPNVKRHPSGIYYEVVRQGKGDNAKYGDLVLFDYKGYIMATNEKFDQTYGNRRPINHVVGKPMFPGMVEAFKLMNEGSLYRFYFPSNMAFGAAGTPNIPPHTAVVYEIELHKINYMQ
ncbi:MAG: FKBP-type peptidyl-prolyl cis-trans isomerase [Bacteroidales bacterium]|nr:FKBP-type peptidyl-prolyl cis-trans isomerase [Bacteroidales bacterium]